MRRRTRQVLELTVGLGLLLGPLVYALSLDRTESADWPTAAAPLETATEEHADRPISAEVVEVVEVVVEPEPAPALDPTPAPTGLAEFLFVTDAGLVLSQEAEHSWGTGRLFEPPGTITYRAAKRADPAKVPADLWSMRARSYDLYGPSGKVCTVRLGDLRVVAQYGGWGLGGVLDGDWYGVDPSEASAKQIRRGVWDQDQAWLVAELSPMGSASKDACNGALWARDAELPPPTILRRSAAPNRVSQARLEAFNRSEQRAEAERQYRKDYAERLAQDPDSAADYTAWDVFVARSDAKVWSWVDAHDQPRFVALEFGQPMEGCGDFFEPWIVTLGQVEGEAVVDFSEDHDPDMMFDADGDGQFERLYVDEYDDVVRLESPTLEQVASVERDWECPC